VHITPIVEAVELGDGSSANIIGKCSLRLNLGPFQDRIVGLVLQNFSQHHDIILGDEFLSKHKAKLDYKHQAVVLYKGNRKFTISLAKTQRLKPAEAPNKAEPVVLSYLQAKRALKKHQDESFVVLVRDQSALGLDSDLEGLMRTLWSP
jgi:hypothetical protein